jgi:superfamily II DNA/RNA helicase
MSIKPSEESSRHHVNDSMTTRHIEQSSDLVRSLTTAHIQQKIENVTPTQSQVNPDAATSGSGAGQSQQGSGDKK